MTTNSTPTQVGRVADLQIVGVPSATGVAYRGRDAVKLRNAVSSRLGPHHMRLPRPEQLDAEFRSVHDGALSMFTLRYGTDAELRLEPERSAYLVFVHGTGRGDMLINGRRTRLFPTVASPEQRVVVRMGADAVVLVLRVPSRMLQGVVARRAPEKSEALGPLVSEMDLRELPVRQWLALARSLPQIGEQGFMARSPLAFAHLERALVAGLLDIQPMVERRDATVEAALAFCEENLERAVTVEEIAQAAHVGVRQLQRAFREELGTTPTALLRARRLERAHAALLDMSVRGGNTSVADIAHRWQFRHLGRFTALYRSSYGQTPAHTARFGLPPRS
jgi:AraC-like DNA-binding protein